MRKFILYEHGGSANHGNEALIRTTVSTIGITRKNGYLISSRPELDQKYGIDKICKIVASPNMKDPYNNRKISKFSLQFLKAYFYYKKTGDSILLDYLPYTMQVKPNMQDIALATGGDNYCYGPESHSALIRNHLIWKKWGVKTILWGCSIEPDSLCDTMLVEDLASYDLITARESITYNALKKVNPNTLLVPDTAFFLETANVELPDTKKNDGYIGINISPLVLGCAEKIGNSDAAIKAISNLIDYIIETTTYSILLIPHVVFDGNNDLDTLKPYYEKYEDSGRIHLIQDDNCEKLKGYISKCRFFIGARTHATIAAYSSCVPTLVIGYSVKSKGIATDLFGTYENYVVPIQDITHDQTLIQAFEWIRENENAIIKHLNHILPEYKARLNKAMDMIQRI